jgi:hypothetical protein
MQEVGKVVGMVMIVAAEMEWMIMARMVGMVAVKMVRMTALRSVGTTKVAEKMGMVVVRPHTMKLVRKPMV